MFEKLLIYGHLFFLIPMEMQTSCLQKTCFSQLTFADIWEAIYWFLEIHGLHCENHWHLEGNLATDHGGHYSGVVDISVAVGSYGGLSRLTRSCSPTQARWCNCRTSNGKAGLSRHVSTTFTIPQGRAAQIAIYQLWYKNNVGSLLYLACLVHPSAFFLNV